jgi:hypothetical protein
MGPRSTTETALDKRFPQTRILAIAARFYEVKIGIFYRMHFDKSTRGISIANSTQMVVTGDRSGAGRLRRIVVVALLQPAVVAVLPEAFWAGPGIGGRAPIDR